MGAHGREETSSSEVVAFHCTTAETGMRLDALIATRASTHSRASVQRWIAQGAVRVDGVVADRKYKASAGAYVEARVMPPPPLQANAESIPLDIVFEDAHLLVVNKAAGMVVHPAPGHASGTLVSALLFHGALQAFDGLSLPTPVAASAGTLRPGIVHRLDKDTSGLLVVAKHPQAHQRLSACFAAHDLDRAYLAIASGDVPAHVIHDTLHGRHPRDRKRFSSRVARGKQAVTEVQRVARLHESSVVCCTLRTGRTHQIRVHLSEAGHPLLGDSMYGKTSKDALVKSVSVQLGRQALHACLLGFAHPMTGVPLRFVAPPPEDFRQALLALGMHESAFPGLTEHAVARCVGSSGVVGSSGAARHP